MTNKTGKEGKKLRIRKNREEWGSVLVRGSTEGGHLGVVFDHSRLFTPLLPSGFHRILRAGGDPASKEPLPSSIGSLMTEDIDCTFGKLPDHLLVEVFVRIPICEWARVSCVKKQWAALFQGECLWKTALVRTWPMAAHGKRWPGPIRRGLSKRRYAALYVSKHIVPFNGEVDELVGHVYLYLKEQLEHSTVPPPSGVLHGTIIDQFIACGKSRDRADELASQIWIAVINHLEENEHTFLLLKHLAQEKEVFLPYPYSRSYRVQWKVFEKLFTDFRDCFHRADYYDVLAYAKYKFQTIPSIWLGY